LPRGRALGCRLRCRRTKPSQPCVLDLQPGHDVEHAGPGIRTSTTAAVTKRSSSRVGWRKFIQTWMMGIQKCR
jgi:hypothetical protein